MTEANEGRLVTRTATLWLDGEGILRIDLHVGAEITAEDMKEHFGLLAAKMP